MKNEIVSNVMIAHNLDLNVIFQTFKNLFGIDPFLKKVSRCILEKKCLLLGLLLWKYINKFASD